MDKGRNKSETTVSTVVGLFLIAGIVAMVIFPTIPSHGDMSPHAVSSNNLVQIAKTYSFYSSTEKTPRTLSPRPGDTAHDAAEILARESNLNDASIWFIRSDPEIKGHKTPKRIVVGDMKTGAIDPAFKNLVLGYVFAANITTEAPVTTTPIAWTRGLRRDGTWAPDSPWQGKGGHIAFLDGHVEWFDKLDETKRNSLIDYVTHKPTKDIQRALPPGAVILSAEPRAPAKP